MNIGVSVNKLLAKMASEFEKPDKLHTLYPREMPKKLWPLPVRELFCQVRGTIPKLYKLIFLPSGSLRTLLPSFWSSISRAMKGDLELRQRFWMTPLLLQGKGS